MSTPAAHVVALLQSEEPLEAYAARHGLDAEELRSWKHVYLAGAASVLVRPRRRWRVGVLAGLVAVAAVIPATVEAGTCASILPAPLVTMCPDEPAVASEVNGNFKVLADNLIGRTGAIGGGSSTQDIHQRSTAVWYADDGSFNLSANQVQLQNVANVSGGNALSPAAGDTLVVNEGGFFAGGTRVDGQLNASGAVNVAGTLSAQGAGFNGHVNFPGGATFYGGTATFQNVPQLQAGLAMNGCYERYGNYSASNTFEWAYCNNGDYMRGMACRGNGVGGIQCVLSCCHP